MSITVDSHTKTIEIREKTVLYSRLREKTQATIQISVNKPERFILLVKSFNFFDRFLQMCEAKSVPIVELLVLENVASLVEAAIGDEVIHIVKGG